uniref:Uncharacterized protein n=1 Tax=Anguilla anguilla TaxID=7936 RepID=A0A0E9WTP2_ANGAN
MDVHSHAETIIHQPFLGFTSLFMAIIRIAVQMLKNVLKY